MAEARARRRRGDWVVAFGPNGEDCRCLRCGDTLKIEKPVLIQVWCAAVKAFGRFHSHCIARPAPEKEATDAR